MFNIGNADNTIIKFNGQFLTDDLFNLKVVDIGEEKKEEGFGINRSTVYVNDTFLEAKENRTTITVTFLRVKNGIPLRIDDIYLRRILTVFFKPKTLVPMIIDGRTYNVIAIDGSIKKFIDNEGYFSISFEAEPYCRCAISDSVNVVLENNKDIELENIGVTNIYFNLVAECIEEGTLTIQGLKKKSDTITLTGSTGGKIVISGDNGDSIGNIDWDCSSLGAFELWYGVNRYRITSTGKWKLNFVFESELPI